MDNSEEMALSSVSNYTLDKYMYRYQNIDQYSDGQLTNIMEFTQPLVEKYSEDVMLNITPGDLYILLGRKLSIEHVIYRNFNYIFGETCEKKPEFKDVGMYGWNENSILVAGPNEIQKIKDAIRITYPENTEIADEINYEIINIDYDISI